MEGRFDKTVVVFENKQSYQHLLNKLVIRKLADCEKKLVIKKLGALLQKRIMKFTAAL